MSNEPNPLPHRLVLLGESLRPVAAWLRSEIARPGESIPEEFFAPGDVSRHLEPIARTARNLAQFIEDLQLKVLHKDDASDAEVHRLAGRLEQLLMEFASAYHAVARMRPTPGSEDPRRLLIAAYHYILTEVADWLDDLVVSLADPIEALRRRGQPTTGEVVLQIDLNLSIPAEFEELNRWANQLILASQQSADQPAPEPPLREPRPGFWSMLGAVGFAWAAAARLAGWKPRR